MEQQEPTDEVRTRRLTIVDDEGRERVQAGATDTGVAFNLLDGDGDVAVSLGATESGMAALSIGSANGSVNVTAHEAMMGIVVLDPDGNPRLQADVDGAGTLVRFHDGQNRLRMMLGTGGQQADYTMLRMYDGDGAVTGIEVHPVGKATQVHGWFEKVTRRVFGRGEYDDDAE